MHNKTVLLNLFMVAVALFAASFILDHFVFTPKPEPGSVHIAAKPTAEQAILAEMLALLIENNTDLKAVVIKGVGGGTTTIHPALVKGDFDLYPECAAAAWEIVLEQKDSPDEAEMMRTLLRIYPLRFDLEWVGMYGIDNAPGLAVREDLAAGRKIASLSDLKAAAGDLVFGAEREFYRAGNGFNALCAAYGYEFKRRVEADAAGKYDALEKGEVDVIRADATDARLRGQALRLLRDDRKFFGTNPCGTVVRRETLKKHPELRKALMKMEGLLDARGMGELNRQVETEKKDARLVAREFLKSKGLLL